MSYSDKHGGKKQKDTSTPLWFTLTLNALYRQELPQ